MPIIKLEDVSKLYGFGDATNIALDDITLSIEEGEFVAVMGPSGSGKSTLMNLIGLLDRPTTGRYTLNGRSVAKLRPNRAAKIRRDTVGFIFQSFNLLPRLTALDNVALPLLYKNISTTRRLKLASAILERVGMQEREYFYPYQLSGGQTQCVAIARALVNNPKIIIADEPTGNLDSAGSRLIMELLSELHKTGNTILFVTHNPELTRYATRVVYMHDGAIIADEPTALGEVAQRAHDIMYKIPTMSEEDELAGVSALMHAVPQKPARKRRKSSSQKRPNAASRKEPTVAKGNIKLALASVRQSRGRSTLTILGVAIGVASVMSIIAIGDGIRQQLTKDSSYLGNNIVTVLPGTGQVGLTAASAAGLTMSDAQALSAVAGVSQVVPFATFSATVTTDELADGQATLLATGDAATTLLSKYLAYGSFYGGEETTTPQVVIGKSIAERFFKQDVPLGRPLQLRGQTFIVQGVFEDFQNTPFSPTSSLNDAILVPIDVAATLEHNNLSVYQIIVSLDQTADQPPTLAAIRQAVQTTHGGQADFRVLAPGESSFSNERLLHTVTVAIGGIAAISLLVAGIGIMNVMLVSVTERMQEIGIRKAVGATSRQIRNQFLAEAAVLSLIGAVIGIAVAVTVEWVLRVLTDLTPVVSWQLAAGAFMVALSLGLLFGSAPAIKAARKDPIEALRRG